MKKEYLILTALILLTSAYLLLNEENKDNYTLPEIEQIDVSKITQLTIENSDQKIEFFKKNGSWVISEKQYPADKSLVTSMLDVIKSFKLSALVSQKANRKRYQLDDGKKIQVKVLKDQKAIFRFTIGKTAPSLRHTFVMLADDTKIYHASGSFRSDFDKTLDEFKEKKE